jgi:glyoxylase-like metal-dependent hydrolase (beta-lactamase superfamily II)
MLVGSGGNIGFSVGDDGVLVIDDQFAQTTPQIIEAIKAVSDKPIRFLGNTHHHGDHSGGNANLEKIGVTIIAHDNARKNLVAENKTEGLPVLTLNDDMNIYINGEQVIIFHVENAHTNGDVMYYFTDSNVLHTGDVYVTKRYPFIDLSSKGSINGFINGVKKALMIIDEDTKIIPGHGELSNKVEYETFLKMLEALKTRVLDEITKGKSEEEIIKNVSITKEYDDLGYSQSFINSERIRQAIYTSLKE